MNRNPKQYLLVHWDWSRVSMIELTPDTISAYQTLFAPHNLWRIGWRENDRALYVDGPEGQELESPRVEVISHRQRQRMIESGFPVDAAANDNALTYDEQEATQASV